MASEIASMVAVYESAVSRLFEDGFERQVAVTGQHALLAKHALDDLHNLVAKVDTALPTPTNVQSKQPQ